MENNEKIALSQKELEISTSIQEQCQYDFRTRIVSTLRYDGVKVDKTERTPEVFNVFCSFYREEAASELGCDASDERIDRILQDAFDSIIQESTEDFLDYKKKMKMVANGIYIAIVIILILAFIFWKLGWNIKM